jgi:LysM repeat protein
MKPYRSAALFFAALCAFLAACETTGWTVQRSKPEDPAITALRADMHLLEERINRVAGDVQALQANYERLQQQVASLHQQLAAMQTAGHGGAVTPATIAHLEQRIAAVDAARRRDVETIVNQVSAELAKLGGGGVSRRSSSAATPPARSAAPRTATSAAASAEQGYEHVVEKGQTLSAIAKAYGVTVDAIKKANNLKSDTLFVGKKLFIPKQ